MKSSPRTLILKLTCLGSPRSAKPSPQPPTCPLRILTAELHRHAPLRITINLANPIQSRTSAPPGVRKDAHSRPRPPTTHFLHRHSLPQPSSSNRPRIRLAPPNPTTRVAPTRTPIESTVNDGQHRRPHDNRHEPHTHESHTVIRAPRTTSQRPVLQKRAGEMREGD